MIGLPIGKQNQYAPGTLAADVHRLLDPYYAYEPGTSPNSAHSLSGKQPKAYVDCAGALHDPDYREFPEFNTRRPSAASGRGAKRATAALRTRRRSISPVRTGFGRPSWERGYTREDDEDSEDEIPDYHPWGFRRAASDLTSSATSGRSRSDSDSSGYYGQPALYNFNHRPSFEEDVDDILEETRVPAEVAAPSKEETLAVCKSTPTCTEAIRYQMTALSLHLRLSVFRAKRRWREKRKGISSG